VKEALQLLQQLAAEKFYGSVLVKFEAGRVTIIKKEQSIKPAESYYQNNWGGRSGNSY